MYDKYGYDYEYDVRYCRPDGTLKNKLGITDQDELRDAEREITSVWMLYLKTQPVRGRLDFDHLRRIHRRMFSDIYTWAGKARTVDISKGNMFCRAMYIEDYAADLFGKLKRENYLIGSPDVTGRLAYYMSEINVLHPFREGNGRTQRVFMEYLGWVSGVHIDFSKVSAEEMIRASAEAFAKRYGRMEAMMRRICAPLPEETRAGWERYFLGRRRAAAEEEVK